MDGAAEACATRRGGPAVGVSGCSGADGAAHSTSLPRGVNGVLWQAQVCARVFASRGGASAAVCGWDAVLFFAPQQVGDVGLDDSALWVCLRQHLGAASQQIEPKLETVITQIWSHERRAAAFVIISSLTATASECNRC